MDWLEQINNKLNVNAKMEKEVMLGVSLKHQSYISVVGLRHGKLTFVQFPQNYDAVANKVFNITFPKKITFKKIKQNAKS